MAAIVLSPRQVSDFVLRMIGPRSKVDDRGFWIASTRLSVFQVLRTSKCSVESLRNPVRCRIAATLWKVGVLDVLVDASQ